MLDDVERRAFLVQPPRKSAPRLAVGPDHVELDERTGQRVVLPRRAGLAGAEPDHRVADPDRLSRLERKVANDAVALVEEAEHRDPLGHRGDPGVDRRALGNVGGDGFLVAALGGARRALVTSAQHQRRRRDQESRADHFYSGFHAW